MGSREIKANARGEEGLIRKHKISAEEEIYNSHEDPTEHRNAISSSNTGSSDYLLGDVMNRVPTRPKQFETRMTTSAQFEFPA